MKVFRAVVKVVTTEYEIRKVADISHGDAKLSFLAGLGEVITDIEDVPARYVEKRTHEVITTWVHDIQTDPCIAEE